VLLASLKTAVDSQTFLISPNAGPSQLRRRAVLALLFSTSWQNDQTPQAMGLYMNQKASSRCSDRPNYAAGKDMLAGREEHVQGQVLARIYGICRAARLLAELTKARNSKAESIFVFYPGAAGVQFSTNIAGRHQNADPASTTGLRSTNCRCRAKRHALAFSRRAGVVNDCQRPEQEIRRRYRRSTRLRPTFSAPNPMMRAVGQ